MCGLKSENSILVNKSQQKSLMFTLQWNDDDCYVRNLTIRRKISRCFLYKNIIHTWSWNLQTMRVRIHSRNIKSIVRHSTIDNCDYIPSNSRHLWNFAFLKTEIIFTLPHITYHPLPPLTYWVDFSLIHSTDIANVMKWKFLFISLSLQRVCEMMKCRAINLKICLPLTRNFNYLLFIPLFFPYIHRSLLLFFYLLWFMK